MIIKSMSRKSASFSQLARYMDKGKTSYKSYEVYYKNLYSRDSEGISKEFKINSEKLCQRKNGNYLYHEVFSIKKNPNLSLEEQKEKLYQLVNDYVELRAKRNLVYGILHSENPENLHFHLMISSNELGSDKRHRLSKEKFARIQKEIEKNILNNFPELEQKIIYNQNKDEKTKKEEYELKKRTGKESDRDIVKDKLTEIFKNSKSKADFFNRLSDNKFEIYIHGNTIGVKWAETGKKYRLKTLGLLDEFNRISGKIEEVEHRKEEVKESRVEPEFKKEKINTRAFRENKPEVKEEPKKEEPKHEFREEAKQEPKQEFKNQDKPKAEDKTFYYEDEPKKEPINKPEQEPIDEFQAEINRRKEELKKSRSSETSYDYRNDKKI